MTVGEREVTRREDPADGRRSLLVVGIWWLTVAIAVLTLAGFVPGLVWVADVAGAFRPHYAVVGLVCLVGMAVARRWAGALVAAAVVAANVAVVAPLWLDAPAPAPGAAPTLTVLWHTVHQVNARRADDLIDAIVAADADVVMLAQVDPGLSRALRGSERLTHDVVYRDVERILVLARVPVTSVTPVGPLPPGSRDAAVAVEVAWAPHDSVAVLGIHTLSPRTPRRTRVRDAELAVAAAWAAAQDGPAVVIGDLNTPPWSAQFRDLARTGGLVDSLRGRGLQPTWPARLGPAGVPIDHALHTPDLAVVTRTTGPAVRSLHRSVRVTVSPAALAVTHRDGSAKLDGIR